LLLIDKEKLNNEFKWIEFTKFKNYLNLIIKEQKEIISENNLDRLVQNIDLEVAEDDDLSNNNSNSEYNQDRVLNEIINQDIEEEMIESNINSDNSSKEYKNKIEVEEDEIISDNEFIFNNSDNLENLINKFENLDFSEEEKSEESDLENIIDNNLLLPLKKRIENKQIKMKNIKPKVIYPKKRKTTSVSIEKKKRSPSKRKKRGWVK